MDQMAASKVPHAVINFIQPTAPEDETRADLYALAARLFYAPPDASLLEVIAGADAVHGDATSAPLAAAWRELQRACASTEEELAQEEYDCIFSGEGKDRVSPHVTAYLDPQSMPGERADLHDFLAAQGMGRSGSLGESEDHIGALFEVMHQLIAERHSGLDEQRFFFRRFVWPGAVSLCDAVIACGNARFYRSVAGFVKGFLALEHAALEML